MEIRDEQQNSNLHEYLQAEIVALREKKDQLSHKNKELLNTNTYLE
jgi:hypothetical protein